MEDLPSIQPENPRAVPGDNKPPGPIDAARETYRALAKFLTDNPVIENEESAAAAKLVFDRVKGSLADLENAKATESKPLYDAWKAKIAEFANPIERVTKLFGELRARMTAYALAEEQKRLAIAAEKVRIAEEAEAKAREAERLEREAKEEAMAGVVVDVAGAIAAADDAFDDFQRAARGAVVADRDSHVKITGGVSRAAGLRKKTIVNIDDPAAVLAAVGMSDDIRDALIKSARAYKKLNGKWPAGVSTDEERSI